jgi:hypothetical protein
VETWAEATEPITAIRAIVATTNRIIAMFFPFATCVSREFISGEQTAAIA